MEGMGVAYTGGAGLSRSGEISLSLLSLMGLREVQMGSRKVEKTWISGDKSKLSLR